MENSEIKNSGGLVKPAINHALIISAALIILTLVMYLTGNIQNRIGSWVSYAILIGGVVYALINYRNETLGGYISYGRVVGYSVVLGLFIGIITGAFTFLLYGFISPELVEEARLEAERRLYRSNPDIDYDMAQGILKMQYWLAKPYVLFMMSILGGAIQGVLIGLIAGIFVKKTDPDAFDV
ncbi:MAG: DUF4199 domain-containing protein [Bacteroidetes bacterium]|nr:MAG: DUF4199 domain-containing protein [Bacteroidota bacterium]